MKILYIASSGGPGGASIALYNLVKGLCKAHDLYVVFPNRGSFSEDVEKLGVTCFYINSYTLSVYPAIRKISDAVKFPLRLTKTLLLNSFAVKKLTTIALKTKPDIIHTNVGPLDIGIKVAHKLHIKHVWHIREYQDLDFGLHFTPSKRKFKKLLNNPINHSIAITQDVFKYWNLRNGIDKVIYDGVICDEKHIKISEKKKYFLFVGRLDNAKGVLLLLHVFAKFCQQNKEYSLLVAGSGSDFFIKKCMNLISNYCILDRVSFLGHRTDVYKLMEEAKALIVPSRHEGFGFITTEAMYNHCLVIGKNTAGTKEQFDIGYEMIGKEIGFRFYTEQELFEKLCNVISLPQNRYTEITEAAYNVVQCNYTIKNHVKNIEAFYKRIK